LPSYTAFGARLSCPFELPELRPAPETSSTTWEIQAHTGAAPTIDVEPLGMDTVFGTTHVRSFGSRDILRLVFDDTGTFDVRRHDRVIAWYRGTHVNDAAMRADLLGRVMALAAHADGGIALHASAVAIDGRAIAFLGSKHAGKSTLAMALVRRGARLLTDDTLVLRFDGGAGGHVWATAGVQRLRLWDDSARALGATASGSSGAKPTVDGLPTHSLQLDDARLVACYILRSAAEHVDSLATRTPLSPVQAALACVSFSKLGSLAGGPESAAMLDRATRVTRASSFHTALVRRDLSRLDETADLIVGWHRSDVEAPAHIR